MDLHRLAIHWEGVAQGHSESGTSWDHSHQLWLYDLHVNFINRLQPIHAYLNTGHIEYVS